MEGIILAGGTGSRLFPATKVLNKHILPLYDKPMIYYSITTLMSIDIRKIHIVCNEEDVKNYKELLGNGSSLGIELFYVIQEKSRGLIDGVYRCKEYIQTKAIVVLLGDNFFYGLGFYDILKKAIAENVGATMFGLRRDHSHTITTIDMCKDKKNSSLVRRCMPKGKTISPGIFVYNTDVFQIIEKIVKKDPQAEWIEVNKEYERKNELIIKILGDELVWYDTGILETRLKAETLVSQMQGSGIYIGCMEEVAYKKNWISRNEIIENLKKMQECDYKQYIWELIKNE